MAIKNVSAQATEVQTLEVLPATRKTRNREARATTINPVPCAENDEEGAENYREPYKAWDGTINGYFESPKASFLRSGADYCGQMLEIKESRAQCIRAAHKLYHVLSSQKEETREAVGRLFELAQAHCKVDEVIQNAMQEAMGLLDPERQAVSYTAPKTSSDAILRRR